MSTKLPPLRVAVTPAEEEDLAALAAGQYLAFGGEDGFFYSTTEPPHIRHPDPLVRVSRFAARLRSILHAPGVLITQARLVNDDGGRGLVVGMAVWHRPGAPVKNIMACDGHEEEEMWQGVDVKQWDGWLNGWDARRKEVLGEEKHWYLGPLWVLPEYKGRGIATQLMEPIFEQARSTGQPVYLEASPEGEPMYRKLGFVMLREEEGREMLWRPAAT